MVPDKVFSTIEAYRQRHIDELVDFLRIPSISTYSHHASDIRKAAEWVLAQITRLGFEAAIHETSRHPLVLGHRLVSPDHPTILIYGHYDVQPPEPLEEWISPPFSPTVRDGYVYARGATDDKGQFLTYLKAMEVILDVTGDLPVNVKVLVEGEEEIASPSLKPYLEKHANELAADAAVISDGSQLARGTPAITYGLRGLAYFQIDVTGPRIDLHSGLFGGVVTNPIQALTEILAALKNPDGTVALPGFYDDVANLEDWERKEMAALPIHESALREYLGVDALTGERDFIVQERRTARPTLDVNGIWGGFSGEGAKTVIPSKAGAKVSMRLVPNQSQERVRRLFHDYLKSLAIPGIKIQVTDLFGADPVLIARERPHIMAAERAIAVGFGKKPLFLREGGSIPIVNYFKDILGIETVLLLGWGSPDDGAHSPNERFHLDDYCHGIRTAAALLYELAA